MCHTLKREKGDTQLNELTFGFIYYLFIITILFNPQLLIMTDVKLQDITHSEIIACTHTNTDYIGAQL